MTDWERLRVGDAVQPLTRMIELADMIVYAGATWDWHRMHYDTELTARLGFPKPVVDGQLFGALLVETVQNWLGPEAFVRSLHFRFATVAFAGETVRCSGEVTEVAAGGRSVAVSLRVEVLDAARAPERLTVGPASATILRRPLARGGILQDTGSDR